MNFVLLFYAIVFACGCYGAYGCPYEPKIKETVYLETHVFADNGFLKKYNNKERDAKIYIVDFWNSVQLRFDNLPFPLKLPLVGITILNDTEDRQVFSGTAASANATSSMTNFKNLLDSTSRLNTSDIVYLLTSRSLYGTSAGRKINASGGFFILGGVCSEHNIAMGIDMPGLFTGFLVAVRHVATLLGARNDGTNGSKCPRAGFLMSHSDKYYDLNVFSECSLQDMDKHLLKINSTRRHCLNRNYTLRDVRQDFMNETLGVAAEALNKTFRCKAYFGRDIYTCRENTEACISTCCKKGHFLDFTWPAIGVLPTADGQLCDWERSKCLNGVCYTPEQYTQFMKEKQDELKKQLDEEKHKYPSTTGSAH